MYNYNKHATRMAVAVLAFAASGILLAVIATWLCSFSKLHEVRADFGWERERGFNSFRIGCKWTCLFGIPLKPQAEAVINRELEHLGWSKANGSAVISTYGGVYLKLIRRDGWQISDPTETSLMKAADSGDFPAMAAALRDTNDINARDQSGWTALMHVAKNGTLEQAKLLISGGADPSAKDHLGRSALFIAAVACRSDIASYLMKVTPHPSLQDDSGNSASNMAPAHCQQSPSEPNE